MYKNDRGNLLVVKQAKNGNFIGEVFFNGVEKRGKWDMRATFCNEDATEYRVCEYFNFPYPNAWWRRFA